MIILSTIQRVVIIKDISLMITFFIRMEDLVKEIFKIFEEEFSTKNKLKLAKLNNFVRKRDYHD